MYKKRYARDSWIPLVAGVAHADICAVCSRFEGIETADGSMTGDILFNIC